MKTKKLVGIFLLSLCTTCFSSCNDDDAVKDPADTVTLNMLNENHGKTFIGSSNFYINKANNFYSSSNFIADVGNGQGVGAKVPLSLANLTQEVAVTPGHIYQIFDRKALMDFPSGNRAIQVESSYYQAYVVSTLSEENIITGAIVKYASITIENNELPAFNHNIGVLHQIGNKVEISLPSNSEYYLDTYNSEEKNSFNIKYIGNKLVLTLEKSPNQVSGPYGVYDIYIRSNNIFTVVNVRVDKQT